MDHAQWLRSMYLRTVFSAVAILTALNLAVLAAPAYSQNLLVSNGNGSAAGGVDLYGNGVYVRNVIPPNNGSNNGLNVPGALTYGLDGNLYVVDQSGSIKEYNGSNGSYIRTVVSTLASLGAGDFAFGPDGDIYVAEPSANRIRKFDPLTGTSLQSYTAGLETPFGIAFLPNGNMLATNLSSDTVTEIDTTTGASSTFATGLTDSATGITEGPDGRYYILEDNGPVVVVGPGGGAVSTWSSGATLLDPSYAIFDDGDLLVADGSQQAGITDETGGILTFGPTGSYESFFSAPYADGLTLNQTGSSTPEPGTVALLTSLVVSGLVFALRRKRHRVPFDTSPTIQTTTN